MAVGVSSTKPLQKFPTIPVPENNLESLFRTVTALKQAVEMLTGGDNRSMTGDSANRFAPHVFIQSTTPVALHPGDLWLCTGNNWTFNIWDGNEWLVLVTVPPPVLTAHSRPFVERAGR
jgi:hypothetical protein